MNEKDRLIHGTDSRGEKCGTSKLTEKDVKEIRALKGYLKQKEIAKLYEIHPTYVSQIQNRKWWSWLE